MLLSKSKLPTLRDFIGVLNLTIDNAPTIPRDNTILFEIVEVTTKPVTGNSENTRGWFLAEAK